MKIAALFAAGLLGLAVAEPPRRRTVSPHEKRKEERRADLLSIAHDPRVTESDRDAARRELDEMDSAPRVSIFGGGPPPIPPTVRSQTSEQERRARLDARLQQIAAEERRKALLTFPQQYAEERAKKRIPPSPAEIAAEEKRRRKAERYAAQDAKRRT